MQLRPCPRIDAKTAALFSSTKQCCPMSQVLTPATSLLPCTHRRTAPVIPFRTSGTRADRPHRPVVDKSKKARGVDTMPKATTFAVGMTCEGCANAVKRILGKMEGVTSVETDVAGQRVVVTAADGTAATAEAMLAALQKWSEASGKSVALLSS